MHRPPGEPPSPSRRAHHAGLTPPERAPCAPDRHPAGEPPSPSRRAHHAPRRAPWPACCAPDHRRRSRESDIPDRGAHHAAPERPRPAPCASDRRRHGRTPAVPDRRSPAGRRPADSARTVTRNRTSAASEGRSSTRSTPSGTGPRAARAARRGPRRPPQSFDSRSTHSWGQVCGHLPPRGGRSASDEGFPDVVHRTRRTVPGSGDARRRCSTRVPAVRPARTPVLHSAHRTYCHCCYLSLGEIQKTRVGER